MLNIVMVMYDQRNVEDVLANTLRRKRSRPRPRSRLGLEVIDADVSIIDVLTGLVWQVQNFSADVRRWRGAPTVR